jgi:hypothetical protein
MTLFKLVGWLVPSGTAKTFKVMYNLEELRKLISRLQYSRSTHVLLGLVMRNALHDSIHAFPMKNVEIDQFVNAYSPDRKSPREILNFIPIADPEKLGVPQP